MYVNGEMRPVETIPEMEVEGVNSTMIYCKNFCKGHNVPTTIKNVHKCDSSK
jgi:hypothetical protein